MLSVLLRKLEYDVTGAHKSYKIFKPYNDEYTYNKEIIFDVKNSGEIIILKNGTRYAYKNILIYY